ncbi:carboxypeptidase-like regulatory domain-containing protein [Anaerotignum sp.]|nr:carboxypeptidase regulatory-like domain-containing protein [Anaerotignum sp.]MBO5329238.1 carboxypeptidase regulatory-like domain-containing protein [Anaerotignum sp.]MBQ8733296.1 carboxypeptidase regulatory-like domain-containing protein [Anaerotignum sp.]
MYPYFQKNTPLHAAETAADDPIRTFLSQNPAFGTLIFQVTGGQGAFPVPNATILLTKQLNDQQSLSFTVVTDESGKTAPVSLPAPSRELSQRPGNGIVFATYQAEISAPNYVTTEIRDLPVFDGITTIQPVSLSPDFGQKTREVEEIEDKEPDL